MPDDPAVIDVPTPTDEGAVVERRVKIQMVPLTEVQQERQRAQAARAEAEAAKARLAELEPLANKWTAHATAEAERLDAANAAALQTLPEAVRPVFQALDRHAMAAALEGLRSMGGQAAAPVAPVKHPVGGGVQQGGSVSTELTTAEAAWVESERRDLRDVSPEIVKRMYAKRNGAT